MPTSSEVRATICELVQQCGGSTEIDRTVPHATALSIVLPDDQVARTRDTNSSPRIVVVDDDIGMRRLVSRILTAAGYHITIATSADEVLSLLEEEQGRIKLVIADVVMPHQSGRQLASKIGSSFPETKVLLMSGYPNLTGLFDGVVGRAEIVKFECRCLQKPFSREELLERVREMLES